MPEHLDVQDSRLEGPGGGREVAAGLGPQGHIQHLFLPLTLSPVRARNAHVLEIQVWSPLVVFMNDLNKGRLSYLGE